MQHRGEHLGDDLTNSKEEKALQKRDKIENLATKLKTYLAGESEDDSVFDEFPREFVPKLARFFRGKGLPEMEATDLAENCATDIALKADRYQFMAAGGFQAWVFKLAYHAWVDWRERRVLTVPILENAPPTSVGIAKRRHHRNVTRVTPDEKVIAAVRDALAQLKLRDRQLIELRDFILDHSYEEIAELLQRNPNALRTQHHRVLKKLKTILKRDPRMGDWINRARRRVEKEG